MFDDDLSIVREVIEEYSKIIEYWARQLNCKRYQMIMLYAMTAWMGIKSAKNFC